ncbi:MAG: hypothetical protein WA373_13120 [Burkholderiales bacterium]
MRAFLLMLLAVAAPAVADDEDAAALLLADKTAATTRHGSDWRAFTEAAWSESTPRGEGAPLHAERLSLDVHYDNTFTSDWRAVFADRLDAKWQDGSSQENNVNTLKEAYLSWQARPDRIADIGRINVRYGVASGYNPTDYFRAGAVRSIVSIDPASLRENRLGSAMLRGQALWTDGSITALYSPKLADQPSDSAFSPDFGATNQRDRWLVSLSHKLSDRVSPQWLVFGGAGQSPQVGLNLSALLNDATVGNVEWSAGRARSLISQALMQSDDTAFRSRLATGLTYTTSGKISITLEYEYNGAGLDQAGWNSLSVGSQAAYASYRGLAANIQDLPTRQNLFLYANWQDALVNHLDLTAMVRHDVVDQSRLLWLEARYHWTRVDVALQWQLNSGQPGSDYGALPDRRILQALVRYFL